MTGQPKSEPKAHNVSVDKVSNIGLQIVRTQPPTKELYKGRGYEAPMAKATCHPCGTQGKHK